MIGAKPGPQRKWLTISSNMRRALQAGKMPKHTVNVSSMRFRRLSAKRVNMEITSNGKQTTQGLHELENRLLKLSKQSLIGLLDYPVLRNNPSNPQKNGVKFSMHGVRCLFNLRFQIPFKFTQKLVGHGRNLISNLNLSVLLRENQACDFLSSSQHWR